MAHKIKCFGEIYCQDKGRHIASSENLQEGTCALQVYTLRGQEVMGNKKQYNSDKTIGCRSCNVIYALCKKCRRKVVYVGETDGRRYITGYKNGYITKMTSVPD